MRKVSLFAPFLALVAAMLLVAAGCGGDPSAHPSSPTTKSGTTPVAEKTAPPDARDKGLVGSAVSTPWELQEIDGATIRVHASGGGCFRYLRTVVDERPDSVLIASLAEDTRPDDGGETMCTANLSIADETLTLDEPLGDRILLHAPVSAAWTSP